MHRLFRNWADGAERFVLSGGQICLVLLGAKTDTAQGWFWAAVAITALSLYGWLAALRRWRNVIDMPVSRIATAAQGYVELSGRGKPLEGLPLLSPLNGLPCLWYRYTIERRESGGDWKHVRNETSDASFILDDGTGICMVDPEGAEILSLRKEVLVRGDERYTQWLLLKDETIHVLGTLRTRTWLDQRQDRQAALGDLLSEWKKDRPQLLKRFDLDGNGEIDLREWALARSAARREIEKRDREAASNADLNMVTYPDDGRPYLISNMPPARVARRYRWWAWGHLALFFAGLAGAAFVWPQLG